jgi:hypothetical protein
VYWNDRLLSTSGYTKYTGQTGSELTGYEGLAALKFTESPYRKLKDSAGNIIDMSHSGRVSADVDGYQDDASGTITGYANALITRPDHIVEHILVNKCGLTAGDISEGSGSGSDFDTENYMEAIVISQPPNIMDLLTRIATQCKSFQYFSFGTHRLRYIPTTETTDKTIYGYMVDAGQLWTKETLRADIENDMTAKYNRDWSGYADNDTPTEDNTVTASSSYSQTLYGTKEKESISLAYAKSSDQAQDCIDYLLSERAYPRRLVTFAGGFFLSELEKGDIIQFSFSAGDRLDDLFSGLVSTDDKFMIIDVSNRSDNAIQIGAIQTAESTTGILTEDRESIHTEDAETILLEG